MSKLSPWMQCASYLQQSRANQSRSLHGVWDRDNPIGAYIYGHTNLTEMSLAFDLF